MWAPANIYDIPTDEDRSMTKEALIELRCDLEDAAEQLDHARADHLRRNIAEREAWLAPVRKLSFDVLAIIFNMTAEDDWRAPMAFCRVWREAVLATHRAWTFDLNDQHSTGLLPLFLNRSGHRQLHVGLRYRGRNGRQDTMPLDTARTKAAHRREISSPQAPSNQ